MELERVFSDAELAELNAALARTARAPYEAGTVHPLTGRITGLCGMRYTGTNRTRQEQRVYRCSGKTGRQPGEGKCTCSQIGAASLEGKVWTEVCRLLEDPARLTAIAADWADMIRSSGVDHEARIADLERQIAGQDVAIAATVMAAAKEQGGVAAAIQKALGPLKEERASLEHLLAEARDWQKAARSAARGAHDLQTLAAVARERLHDMRPEEQAEVLDLMDVRVTLLGEVPRRVRKDDEIAAWFRDRRRDVPVITDDTWALVEPVFPSHWRGRPTRPARPLFEAILYKATHGCPWRALPGKYGPWGTVVSTWRRWSQCEVWDQAMERLAGVPAVPLPDGGVCLPPLRVEGKLDPRLLISTHAPPSTGLSNDHIVGLTYVP
ncbi:transposase [Streptomyces sp. YS-3]|uniref:transposase n=1 Tax=Streptomyces sp. YS-3 TaxID=3381352 RepID=UPI0038623FEE